MLPSPLFKPKIMKNFKSCHSLAAILVEDQICVSCSTAAVDNCMTWCTFPPFTDQCHTLIVFFGVILSVPYLFYIHENFKEDVVRESRIVVLWHLCFCFDSERFTTMTSLSGKHIIIMLSFNDNKLGGMAPSAYTTHYPKHQTQGKLRNFWNWTLWSHFSQLKPPKGSFKLDKKNFKLMLLDALEKHLEVGVIFSQKSSKLSH